MAEHTVFIVGSGASEHVLAWALARSPQVGQIYVAPGNAGTEWTERDVARDAPALAASQNVSIEATNVDGLVKFAKSKQVDLTVVGSPQALLAGVADKFKQAGLAIFAPLQAVAQLEKSKGYTREFLKHHNVPTPKHGVFSEYEAAKDFIDNFDSPVVVKADGSSGGRGVIICKGSKQARAALNHIMVVRVFGKAGDRVVVEEKLEGSEIAMMAFTDGKTIKPLVPARSYNRAYEGNQGPNTAGMGALSPVKEIKTSQVDSIVQTIFKPIVDGMAQQGTPFVGIIYGDIILTGDGPKVVDINTIFGDPETSTVLPLLQTDIFDVMMACVNGTLDQVNLEWQVETCATIVMASPGYPGTYFPTGLPITGLDTVNLLNDIFVFHAETSGKNGRIVTNGGRVLSVTALGDDLSVALLRAYDGVKRIQFEGAQYRRDIGRSRPRKFRTSFRRPK
ncbi:MAG: phosphoribosylamine--glycine ligase [Anaerolineaceae bacterium 4572_78]|nr:MAG: phosphoribosylamine--glycine ligase [Anaerolineaceae bacterium 4572_78]